MNNHDHVTGRDDKWIAKTGIKNTRSAVTTMMKDFDDIVEEMAKQAFFGAVTAVLMKQIKWRSHHGKWRIFLMMRL